MSLERELAVATRAVREAARVCEAVRGEMVTPALTKEDRSPVTVADFGAQAVVCRTLGLEFPDDPVVGEEHRIGPHVDHRAQARGADPGIARPERHQGLVLDRPAEVGERSLITDVPEPDEA